MQLEPNGMHRHRWKERTLCLVYALLAPPAVPYNRATYTAAHKNLQIKCKIACKEKILAQMFCLLIKYEPNTSNHIASPSFAQPRWSISRPYGYGNECACCVNTATVSINSLLSLGRFGLFALPVIRNRCIFIPIVPCTMDGLSDSTVVIIIISALLFSWATSNGTVSCIRAVRCSCGDTPPSNRLKVTKHPQWYTHSTAHHSSENEYMLVGDMFQKCLFFFHSGHKTAPMVLN